MVKPWSNMVQLETFSFIRGAVVNLIYAKFCFRVKIPSTQPPVGRLEPGQWPPSQYGPKGSQNETSSITSSPTPQSPHTPTYLKTQWSKRLPKCDELPYKHPNPLITIYHNRPQNTVGKKAPKMRWATLQAPQPPNYQLPKPISNHSGQKSS